MPSHMSKKRKASDTGELGGVPNKAPQKADVLIPEEVRTVLLPAAQSYSRRFSRR